ncbi:MAG TPA: CaiB/BaiF CoA-transferase family protein [Thermomicrobiales bacterium]|nr:CaiB/BaiF CoA-transferase family protein [Thermomicrobiales bacterium]
MRRHAYHPRQNQVDHRSEMKTLSGIKIMSLTQFLLGPAGVQYLADLGADVIKIEPPGGAWERTWSGANHFLNGISPFFMLSHRNVRSITLNLKQQEAQAVARRLIASADVLVQNFRPGVVKRFGLDYDAVRRINPRLVYASVSGYGEESPDRALPGQDLLIQAMSGLMAATGRASEPPTPAGAAIVDQHGAALLAMGILAALFHRERTGEGQKIEVTMIQAALDLQLEPVTYYLNGAHLARPAHAIASTFHSAPYGVYETADGHMVLSMTSVRTLSEALGGVQALEPYETPALAMPQREEIAEILMPILRGRSTAEWIATLRERGVWCAPVNGYDEVFAEPAVQYLDPVQEFDHPEAGHVRLLKHPVRYGVGEPGVQRLPPGIGEHTLEVLQDAGYSADEIENLRVTGAL